MGTYLNSGNTRFKQAVESEIYRDKTDLLIYINSLVLTEQKYVCVSRPRRFGKTITANMIAAYMIDTRTAGGCLKIKKLLLVETVEINGTDILGSLTLSK